MMMSFKSGYGSFFLQFGFQRGKRLDHAHEIFVRADSSGIKQEMDRSPDSAPRSVAVRGTGVAVQKAFIDSVVNDFDAVGRNVEQLLDFILGEIRNREDARGAARELCWSTGSADERQKPLCSRAREKWSSMSCTVMT